ncbi:lipocalin family protein [Motilimonas cestriensis]|uniref:Outer membrane lipoprotein Blc n=1 Tax=Motilimonas cestriensis TaxID=2742685 RepID=A0ABS8WDD9_9GAMM|nr:lipocalin family protein [Motilimonas cestriensis]MCE2597061.1 lipocalin family protein [Motilimonas cestriensis]
MATWQKWLLSCGALLLNACTGLPEGITPVTPFSSERYLGTWYEIARLDHSFERGLNQVSATYSMREDGGIKVLNKGFNTAERTWQEAEGKAYFVRDDNEGYLKVSFFGPFYGAYVVFDLDQENYQYSFIAGNNRDYLWLLSRTPTVTDAVKQDFIQQAKALGFNTDALIFVEQSATDTSAP